MSETKTAVVKVKSFAQFCDHRSRVWQRATGTFTAIDEYEYNAIQRHAWNSALEEAAECVTFTRSTQGNREAILALKQKD